MTANDPVTTHITELKDLATDLNTRAVEIEEQAPMVRTAFKMLQGAADALDLDREYPPPLLDDFAEHANETFAAIHIACDAITSTLDDARELADYCSTLFEAFDAADLGASDLEAQRTATRILRALPVAAGTSE